MDLHPKVEFFLDLFRVAALKNVIIQEDKKFVQEILQGIEKTTRADNQQTLVKVNFLLKAFTSLKTSSYDNLSTTSPVFFHFVEGFGKLHGAKHFIYI